MIEVTGDLFEYPADATCITTNGSIKKNGACVMGRGVAQYVCDNFPGSDLLLGACISLHGNHTQMFMVRGDRPNQNWLVALPVKHHWHERADLQLITRSLGELVTMTIQEDWQTVTLPRPGCGNGGLDWAEVGPLVHDILGDDDRFVVVNKPLAH
jgi:hypothetical protein